MNRRPVAALRWRRTAATCSSVSNRERASWSPRWNRNIDARIS
jgi:hypothetical protein